MCVCDHWAHTPKVILYFFAHISQPSTSLPRGHTKASQDLQRVLGLPWVFRPTEQALAYLQDIREAWGPGWTQPTWNMAPSSKGHKTKNYSLFCTSLTIFSHMSSWLSLLQLRTLSAHYREEIKPQPFVQSCKLRYIVKRKSVGSHQKAGRTYIWLRPQERRKQTRLKWF